MSAETELLGFCGLSAAEQKKILEARCGGLCYIPPEEKKPAEVKIEEKEKKTDERNNQVD